MFSARIDMPAVFVSPRQIVTCILWALRTSPTAHVTVQSCGGIPSPSAANEAVCMHLQKLLPSQQREASRIAWVSTYETYRKNGEIKTFLMPNPFSLAATFLAYKVQIDHVQLQIEERGAVNQKPEQQFRYI